MDYYIPNRKDKIQKNSSLGKEDKEENIEEIFLGNNNEKTISNLEKDKMLENLLKNEKFKEVINEIETKKDKKEILNLAQFKRFYKFIEDKNFDFFDRNEEVKKFIQKQKDRKVAEKFYNFIEDKFMSEVSRLELKENEELRNDFCIKAKQRLKIMEKYLLYIFGKKRIKEKLDKMEVK